MKWLVIYYFITAVCGTVKGAEAPPYFYAHQCETLKEAKEWANKEKDDLNGDFKYWIVYGDPETFNE